jgi:hypothetical protein
MGLAFPCSSFFGFSTWTWGEFFVLAGFLLAYGFLLLGVFFLFWR